MRPIIFPYNLGSEGARLLAQQLDTIRVRPNGRYRPRGNHCVINWGNSTVPEWGRRYGRPPTFLNSLEAVAVASDKLRTFEAFRRANIPHPEWTTDRNQALQFFGERGRGKVVCRTLLRASEGRGIVIAENPEQLVPAPLYVKLFPKQDEYRIHVFNGEVIDEVQKRLRNGERTREGRSRYIRSHNEGWVFAREGVRVPEQARGIACSACAGLGLTFGAVDLAVNKDGEIRVFEVNTAPGIEGTTVTKYAEAIRRYCAN